MQIRGEIFQFNFKVGTSIVVKVNAKSYFICNDLAIIFVCLSIDFLIIAVRIRLIRASTSNATGTNTTTENNEARRTIFLVCEQNEFARIF